MIWCSGPGAMAVIERNEAFGWKMLAIAGLLAVAVVAVSIAKKRASRWLWPTVIFTIIHPAVWMGARRGDCGHMLYFASIGATVLVGLFAVTAALSARSQRGRGSDPGR
jgi:hypothetical protein